MMPLFVHDFSIIEIFRIKNVLFFKTRAKFFLCANFFKHVCVASALPLVKIKKTKHD
jgi:hypothetical protein